MKVASTPALISVRPRRQVEANLLILDLHYRSQQARCRHLRQDPKLQPVQRPCICFYLLSHPPGNCLRHIAAIRLVRKLIEYFLLKNCR